MYRFKNYIRRRNYKMTKCFSEDIDIYNFKIIYHVENELL